MIMAAAMKGVLLWIMALLAVLMVGSSNGSVPESSMREVWRMNKDEGPFLGIVVPNAFEMSPLLQSPSFLPHKGLPYLDIAGRRFRFGRINQENVVMVMTGLGMVNAGLTTQLLLALFNVKGVVHFGIAGNANPDLQIGDVTIPQYWAHTGLWYWQKYGDGPDDELSLESNGDYTRTIGYLNMSRYSTMTGNKKSSANLLNSAWYQPEEIFPINGVPEVRQHAFWVPIDKHYFEISRKLEVMELERCVNSTTCLPRSPKVTMVSRGCSANTFVDNAAYRQFLNSKFNVTPVDMETAAVSLVCLQQDARFIAIRSLSDLAGGGSALSNEASVYGTLAANNAVSVAIQFISLLSSSSSSSSSSI